VSDYDLVIVGMGSGGITAAEFAAGLGLRVAAVDRARIGGDCLWTGCVPSKALLASAKVAHTMRTAHEVGITPVSPVIDLPTVWRRVRAVQAEIALTDDNPLRFRELGVELLSGPARITGPTEVTVDTPNGTTAVLTTRFVLVCTGSRPHVPVIDGLTPGTFLTSEDLFLVQDPPRAVAIVGGGPMGVEMAQAMSRLAIETTVFQRARTLLPRSEASLVERLTGLLRKEGVVVHCSADVRTVTARASGGSSVTAVVGDDGQEVAVEVDTVLVAAGRTPNTEGLGLADIGVELTPRGVQVDARGRTTVRTVYAVGDVAGRRLLSNGAGYEAVQAVRDMFFPGRGNADAVVPSCVFTDPELASVGLTADEAEAQFGTDTDIWRIELRHNDRARAEARAEGAVMVVTAKGRVVGAHVLAPAAGEMIHELSAAVQREMRLDELAEIVHVYPTLASSIGQLATESAFEKAQRLRWLMKRR
jgi:pyruvate/2-oxoglutarate dehydrogenase complex dihydrolipoamide dehydrogenase (E3) component